MRIERRGNFAAARLWIASQQCRGRNQDARQAIAALAGLLGEERLLQRVQRAVVREALDCGDGATGDGRQLARARVRGLAVDQHHAGAALLGAATEPAAAQAELVAQHRKERSGSVGLDANGLAVDDEVVCFIHSGLMPLASMNVVQFLISLSSFARKAGAGAKSGVMSSLASRSRRRGSAITVEIACSSSAFTASGMPLGPKIANQKRSSTSAGLTPASRMVGTFGIAGERAGLVTASALTLPPSTRLLVACTDVMVIGTWPATTSPIAWPPPL